VRSRNAAIQLGHCEIKIRPLVVKTASTCQGNDFGASRFWNRAAQYPAHSQAKHLTASALPPLGPFSLLCGIAMGIDPADCLERRFGFRISHAEHLSEAQGLCRFAEEEVLGHRRSRF
jgi:hypothetical protein